MSLRSAAVAAYEADHEAATRAQLANVLSPFDVSTLQLQRLDLTNKYALGIYTDGDITLGSQVFHDATPDRVGIVEVASDGKVTLKAEVKSLPHLGELLPVHDPVDENAPA